MPNKPSSMGLVTGLIGAGVSGFSTFNSLKAPSAGNFGDKGFGYYSETQGLGQFNGSFSNNPFTFNNSYSLPSAAKWNNTFGLGS